jgi:hypothetical protein
MASRLYPGFGSGKGTFESILKVNSFATIHRTDLEAGDKVLLPASAFKEISRLRLAMPLLFQVYNDKLKSAATMPQRPGAPPAPPLLEQLCGVLEFSAPEGQAYIPSWMLRNLKLRDGGTARFATLRDVPPGSFVKFRPYRYIYNLVLAASSGPRFPPGLCVLLVAARNSVPAYSLCTTSLLSTRLILFTPVQR